MRTLPLLTLMACANPNAAQDWQDWFDPGTQFEVEEPIAFTDVNYDFTGPVAIADLPRPPDDGTLFSADTVLPTEACENWENHAELPAVIEGIVTIHPRYYIKVTGCIVDPDDFSIDNEEKYYGSFFVQDASGGYFVLGDSKVAHFDMGDRVRIEVQAVKSYFENVMISAHEVVEVTRGPEPIYYRVVEDALLAAGDVGDVVRVSGFVAADAGTFGEVYLCTDPNADTTVTPDLERDDDGSELAPACAHLDQEGWFKVQVDVELSRRGVSFDKGSELQVTGPVFESFGDYPVVVMRVGQVTEL